MPIQIKQSYYHYPNPLLAFAPTAARFLLEVLPQVEDTLPVAEVVRRTLMGIYKRLKLRELFGRKIPSDPPTIASEVFSGKDSSGQPLKGHQHAFFLPTDEDRDGRIDHVTVFAARGFDRLEVAALHQLRRLAFRDQDARPMTLALVGMGRAEEMAAPLLGNSAAWVSVAPFLATRMPKRRGRKKDPPHLLGRANERAFAEQVLREELQRRGYPEPTTITPLEGHRLGHHQLRPIQFKRFRSKRSDDGGRRPAGAFCITFASPVRGPICLGHSSHFGLGLFLPDEKEDQ